LAAKKLKKLEQKKEGRKGRSGRTNAKAMSEIGITISSFDEGRG